MRFILLNIIFTLSFSSKLYCQDNSEKQWESSEDIYERLNYHKDHFNVDSTIYYMDELIKFQSKTGNEAAIITAYNQKINNLILFKRYNEGFEIALTIYEKYCIKNRKEKNCTPCGYVYES